MKARIYIGQRMVGEVELADLPRDERGQPRPPAPADEIAVAIVDEHDRGRAPLFLHGRLEPIR